jgi:tRNA(Ile)-lysidine synthase
LSGFLKRNGVTTLDRDLVERALDLLDVEKPAVVNLPGGGKLRRRAGRLWVEL